MTRAEMERELYKIRATYLGSMRNEQIRQAGILRLRAFTDPIIYPKLIEIFKREKPDVRLALLDHFADRQTDQGDATLAWLAIHDHDEKIRAAATERLGTRLRQTGVFSPRLRIVFSSALQGSDGRLAGVAASAADTLHLVQLIPLLITTQVRQQAAAAGAGGDSGALGFILVAQQTAFVSDLEPVVADSAVGFDPQLSVLTEGVYLRVKDAVVYTYRVEVNSALIRLSGRAWGQPTGRFGWDVPAWANWYKKEFQPFRAANPDRALPARPPADPTATPAPAPATNPPTPTPAPSPPPAKGGG